MSSPGCPLPTRAPITKMQMFSGGPGTTAAHSRLMPSSIGSSRRSGAAEHPRRPRVLDESKPVALLLAGLGVTQSHSRPHVSNDNPFSESQFKTMKYRPAFPARFGSIEAARAYCQEFFPWYNNEHRHGGLGLHTAADVHHGRAAAVRAARAQVLDAAYLAHPERFVRKPPAPPKLPGTSWINPPQDKETDTQ
jgi:Integrase core domain